MAQMYCNSDLLYRFLDFLTMHCNEALAPQADVANPEGDSSVSGSGETASPSRVENSSSALDELRHY